MRRRGASLFACAVVILLCAGNPLTLPALQLGHPEDLLGAVLCITGVLCAINDRPIWAAVLVGLAIPNKEWAVLAVGPVLVALHRTRVRALLVSGGVAGVLLAPLLLRAAGGFVAQASSVGLHSGYRLPPAWITSLAHALVITIMLPLSALYARLARTRGRHPNDVLLLLALLFALRCVLDPWDISYYSLPFLLALLTWESLSFDRPPALTLAASFAAWLILRGTGTGALNLPPDVQAAVFAIVSIPSLIALIGAVYVPGVWPRLAWRRQSAPRIAAAVQPSA
jgi:hypothetical protein